VALVRGAVITQAGNDPKVSVLVYITAFAPDKGESVQSLSRTRPRERRCRRSAPQDGFLFLDREKFPASFAETSRRRSRVPGRLTGALGSRGAERHHHGAGVKSKPSWYHPRHRRQDDPIAAQRMMAKRRARRSAEVGGSHAIYVSNPKAVADIIGKASRARRDRPTRLRPANCSTARASAAMRDACKIPSDKEDKAMQRRWTVRLAVLRDGGISCSGRRLALAEGQGAGRHDPPVRMVRSLPESAASWGRARAFLPGEDLSREGGEAPPWPKFGITRAEASGNVYKT
jgi:hypothetical protein